jgi:hypothetical protein
MAAPTELRFCWWNVQDFAHFDPSQAVIDRWPRTAAEYAEKTRRVLAAFDAMFGPSPPDIIGLCEITRTAAEALRRARLPDHQIIFTDAGDPFAFQVVLFIRDKRGLQKRIEWIPEDVSAGTRPMGVIRYLSTNAHILFVACHWPAFEESTSREARRRCADTLRGGIYDFLFPRTPATIPRHVVAFGDFNTEPHDDLFTDTLYASRDRDHARRRRHHTDEPVRRVRLYNCGWRLVGESHSHGQAEPTERRVGTYYSASKHEWRTYDQVLVTGGLLTGKTPYLDEGELLIRTDAGNLIDNKPAKFRVENGVGYGLSDHYPLTGRIVLG